MARVTINIDDKRYQALKEAAVRRRTTIGRLVEQSLDFYGIKTEQSAADLVAAARRRSAMNDHDATNLSVEETRSERGR